MNGSSQTPKCDVQSAARLARQGCGRVVLVLYWHGAGAACAARMKCIAWQQHVHVASKCDILIFKDIYIRLLLILYIYFLKK
jgi:hypothetical protein